MTLAELGAKLREAREARGLTVADAADYLKIPSRILEGAEEGADHLPRTVYVYHFIKDYAKYLGFSASEAGTWLSSVEGFENISRPVIVESAPFTPVKPSVLPAVIGVVLKLGVVAALAFGAYTAYVHFFAGRDYEDLVKLPAAQEQAAPAAPSSASPSAAPVWEPAAPEKAGESGPAASGKAEAPAPSSVSAQPAESAVSADKADAAPQAPQWDVPASSVQEQEAAASPAVTQAMPEDAPAVSFAGAAPAGNAVGDSPATASASASVPAADVTQPALSEAPAVSAAADAFPDVTALEQRVEVIADSGDCWMGFEADGRKQQRFLRKGGSFMLSFRDSLVLKLGDAGAVRVLHNGKELERAAAGRVLTLRFPRP